MDIRKNIATQTRSWDLKCLVHGSLWLYSWSAYTIIGHWSPDTVISPLESLVWILGVENIDLTVNIAVRNYMMYFKSFQSKPVGQRSAPMAGWWYLRFTLTLQERGGFNATSRGVIQSRTVPFKLLVSSDLTLETPFWILMQYYMRVVQWCWREHTKSAISMASSLEHSISLLVKCSTIPESFWNTQCSLLSLYEAIGSISTTIDLNKRGCTHKGGLLLECQCHHLCIRCCLWSMLGHYTWHALFCQNVTCGELRDRWCSWIDHNIPVRIGCQWWLKGKTTTLYLTYAFFLGPHLRAVMFGSSVWAFVDSSTSMVMGSSSHGAVAARGLRQKVGRKLQGLQSEF